MENLTSSIRSEVERIIEISNNGHNGDIKYNLQSFGGGAEISCCQNVMVVVKILNIYFIF